MTDPNPNIPMMRRRARVTGILSSARQERRERAQKFMRPAYDTKANMSNGKKPIEPREFILNAPNPTLTQADVRDYLLQADFPPAWGLNMESEIRSRLTALGFLKIWCQCQEIHRIVRMRMSYGAGARPPAAAIKRLLRRMARELGSPVTSGGMNVWVERDRIEAAIVMEQPAA
jgi:hypothetical protein